MAEIAQIFTNTAQHNYVEIICGEFHPYRSRNVESASRNSLMPLSKAWLSLS